jgi:hypothetical protein
MNNKRIKQASIFSVAALLLISCSGQNQVNTQTNAEKKQASLSVSGLSSGAFMAIQFHLAHSERVIGSGLISGGPFYCAQGSIGTALQNCVANPDANIDLTVINAVLAEYQQDGRLSAPEHNANDRVWMLHGTLDTRINHSVSDKLAEQVNTLFQPDNTQYIKDQAFSHLMPTISSGGKCDESITPFIGSCQYDAAGKLLNFISPLPNDRSAKNNDTLSQQLVSFKQGEYAGKHATTLGEEAFLFVPESCKGDANCDVHVSFHGCNQNAEAVGDEYAKNSGFNAWADTNNLIVLYPQTKKSAFMPLNPQACWDWWGYTGADYANKNGKQIQAVMSLVDNIPNIIQNDK